MSQTPGYEPAVQALQRIIQMPMQLNNISIVLLDALSAYHAPEWTVVEHQHPWFEYNYVSAGSVLTTIEGRDFPIRDTQSYLIPPSVWHHHRHPPGCFDDGFCLRWKLTRIGDSHLETAEQRDMIQTFNKVRPHAFQVALQDVLLRLDPSMSLFSIQIEFLRWFASMYEAWRDPLLLSERPGKDRSNHPIVHQALLYLEEYYATDIQVHDLANALHISYRHLARLFKQETGNSIIEQLNEIRIKHAKKLLRETLLTTREIAYRTGLTNEQYLSSLFSRLELTTPTRYRKSITQAKELRI